LTIAATLPPLHRAKICNHKSTYKQLCLGWYLKKESIFTELSSLQSRWDRENPCLGKRCAKEVLV